MDYIAHPSATTQPTFPVTALAHPSSPAKVHLSDDAIFRSLLDRIIHLLKGLGSVFQFVLAAGPKCPILSIEEGLAENDWDGWKLLNRTIGHKTALLGSGLDLSGFGTEEDIAGAIMGRLKG